jgi:hypothetical protein
MKKVSIACLINLFRFSSWSKIDMAKARLLTSITCVVCIEKFALFCHNLFHMNKLKVQ